jgi:hypothetical protein
MLKKKIWASFQRIIELVTKKLVTRLSKIWIWDPGSEIREPGKTYSGFQGSNSTGSRISDPGSRILGPDPQHWMKYAKLKQNAS